MVAKLLQPDAASSLIASLLSGSRNRNAASKSSIQEHYAVPLRTYVAGNALQHQYAAINGIRSRVHRPDPVPYYHHGDGYVGAGALLEYNPSGAAAIGIDRLRDSYPVVMPDLPANNRLDPRSADVVAAYYKMLETQSHISSGALHAYINSNRTRYGRK